MNLREKRRFLIPPFLSPLLIIGMGLGSTPAHALRPMPDQSGLEEVLQPSADSTGLEEDWKELDYHLHRLETGDTDAKRMAVEAILDGLIKRPGFSRTEKIVDALYKLRKTPHPSLRAELFKVLIYSGFHRKEVQRDFEETIRNFSREDPRVIQRGLDGLELRIRHGRASSLKVKNAIVQLSELFLFLLEHPDPEVVLSDLSLLEILMGHTSLHPDATQGEVFIGPGQFKRKPWLEVLDRLMRTHDDDRIRLRSARILNLLGEKVEPRFLLLFQAEQTGSIVDYFAAGDLLLKERPLKSELTPEQMAQLHQQIQEEGDLPRNFLRELFREGKRILFLQFHGMNYQNAVRLGIVQDVLSLSQDEEMGPIYLALLFPPSLGKDFQVFLRGGNPPDFLKVLLDAFGLDAKDPGNLERFERDKEDFRNRMRQLEGHMTLLFFDAEPGVTGENAFDSWQENLAQVLRKEKNARILVYAPLDDPLASRTGLITVRQKEERQSLAPSFAEQLGPDRVASILEQTEGIWEDQSFLRTHNLAEFLHRYPIPTSFGLGLGATELDSLKFDNAYQETYSQAWDGVIFRKEGGEEDPDFFAQPELPKPEAIQPTSPRELVPVGPWASHDAGLEEKIQGELATLAKAAEKKPGVLVIETQAISRRVGLEEFVARMPKGIWKVVIAGQGSAVAKEVAARNGNVIVVDSDRIEDLGAALAGLEEADHVLFLGDRGRAQILSRILPPSMAVTPIDSTAGLEEILLAMGIPKKVLDPVNAAGLEEELARLHAA